MQKQDIRREIIQKCKAISPVQRLLAEATVLHQIKPLLQSANSIAIYHAYAWELSLTAIIDFCLTEGKQLYQPVAYRDSRIMQLTDFDPGHTTVFSPREYTPSQQRWYNLDLVLLPTVAVDRRGYRLGKGGGYYDTTLATLSSQVPVTCAVGFSCQQLEFDLVIQVWDMQLDYFVTENGINNFIGT